VHQKTSLQSENKQKMEVIDVRRKYHFPDGEKKEKRACARYSTPGALGA
jgi:hypothetical protein